MSTTEIISIITKAKETGSAINHPELESAFNATISNFSLDTVVQLQQTAMMATVEPNSVAANFVTALQKIPTITKLSKKKLKGDILQEHEQLDKIDHALPNKVSNTKSTKSQSKEYTAKKQTTSTAGKKSTAETTFERALEFQKLKSQLKKLAAARDSVRQNLLM